MKVDSAVIQALRLDPAETTVTSHGGSGFSSTMKISGVLRDDDDNDDDDDDGTQQQKQALFFFFMKTGHGKDAETMFAGEHASLNALHTTIPSLCPQSFAHGKLADSPGGAFLVTDFLDMRSTGNSSSNSSSSHHSSATAGSGHSLAAKLAKLHTTPAPIPEGFSRPVFGFPVPTCCGSTEQENDFTEDWADFYAEHRLRFILRQSEKNNGKKDDGALRGLVERTAGEVVPRLLDKDHLNRGKGVQPVVIHGDVGSQLLPTVLLNSTLYYTKSALTHTAVERQQG